MATTLRGAHRDKRYTIPILTVDMLQPAHETRLWSTKQIILRDFTGRIGEGARISGGFRFEERGPQGFFEAQVARVDPSRKMLGAAINWLSADGEKMLELNNQVKPEEAPLQVKTLRVNLMHSSINWSLSGMLVDQFFTDLPGGQQVRGLVRLQKSLQAAVFPATVIRANLERHTLALKFNSLPPETFALLENAMKKGS